MLIIRFSQENINNNLNIKIDLEGIGSKTDLLRSPSKGKKVCVNPRAQQTNQKAKDR
jgi:hypothetical protein